MVPGVSDEVPEEVGDVKAELEVVRLVKAELVVEEALKIPPAGKDAPVAGVVVWEKSVEATEVVEPPPDGTERLKEGDPPAGGAENSPMVRTGVEEVVVEVEAEAVEMVEEAEVVEVPL